jgi:hypothetical protein
MLRFHKDEVEEKLRRQVLFKAISDLSRVSANLSGVDEVAYSPHGFREGHEDEYEAMVNFETLKDLGCSPVEYSQIMPDLARCARGLCTHPALSIEKSANGILCCNHVKLREHLHMELGVFLVKGNREGFPFALWIPVHVQDNTSINVKSPSHKTFLIEGSCIMRLITAYRKHNSSSLPLFLDFQTVPSDADPELVKLFECSVCLDIMKDPASLGCGHSGCLRYRP